MSHSHNNNRPAVTVRLGSPIEGNCLVTNVVYAATVETLDALDEAVEEQSYTGLVESWKPSFYQHRSSFTHRTGRQTSLSNHIWKLRDQDLDYRLTWGVLGHARPYNPVTGLCRLCLLEKYFILYGQKATLNKWTEIYGWCHHKSKYFLSIFI